MQEIIEIVKATDGLVAVVVMLWIGRELRSLYQQQWETIWKLIDKLTDDDQEP